MAQYGDNSQIILDELSKGPKTAAELAKAVYQDDSRYHVVCVQETISKLRNRRGLRIRTELYYEWGK